MAYQTESDFPTFANGDVAINLGAGQRYVLHAETLRRGSKFFAERLTEDQTPVPAKKGKDVQRIRWRFELVERPAADDTGPGVLEMLELNDKGHTVPHSRRCPPDVENGKMPNPIYDHYRRVLGALYAFTFDVAADDITEVLRDVLGLIEVGEYIGCVPMIARTIDLALVSQGVTLYRSISGNPVAWLSLSMRVQSEIVFREGVIHIVGKWNALSDQEKASLPAAAHEVCERKHTILDQAKAQIEHDIVKHYPPELERCADDGTRAYNRQNYGNDILNWLAVTLFKHWYAAALVGDKNRHAKDGGFWLYKVIAEGGDAYLTNVDQGAFHKRFPMSVKGGQVFAHHLSCMKEGVKQYVEPLLVNHSQLDVKAEGVKYLTCTEVNKHDLPWYVRDTTPFGGQPSNNGGFDEGIQGMQYYEEEYDNEDLYDDEPEPMPKRIKHTH
ncbi:hypothetical protein NA57DRAFT_51368 [Rhizodiscina lignyota]|uniref:BTB domain-containing protein n=1 Tax=Rhizodiscina lignyota TaxID=1504668 RepID=A0A9P4INV1_9PEZI|nr:hypothetical protein NA57DRAFT_51368 [Rhizodiscina lignyota]